MTSTYLFYFSKIIYLNIFPKLLSFVYVTSKLNILFNYTKHLQKLALYYILPLFTILKSLYLICQPTYLENNFNLKKKLSYI